MQNLIGPLVGMTNHVTFDPHSELIIETLINKDREEVLAAFFKYVTPETMVEKLVSNFSDTENALTRREAVLLLMDLGYLNHS